MALSSARFPPLLLLTFGLAVGLSELSLPLLPETSLSGGSSALATGNVSRVGKAGGGGNSSLSGSSEAAGPGGKSKKDGEYSGTRPSDMMIQRALYVLIVVTAFVIIYFVVRTVRMRKVNRKTRKYGVLNTHLENMEMRPLDQEDDEEDDTLFDANHSRR